ncbi:MAG: hypothetical protein IPM17_09150 [Verrucomicrobia bacterium]|nr:hypothetical protein [Verrucomicrobiota bacterium]
MPPAFGFMSQFPSSARSLVLAFAWMAIGLPAFAGNHGYSAAGPAWQRFRLTLQPGERTEGFGPFWSEETVWNSRSALEAGIVDPLAPPPGLTTVQARAATIAFAPFFSQHREYEADGTTIHVLYPLVTYHRYGEQRSFQIAQLFALRGGPNQAGDTVRRFTLFPFYFQQRAEDPSLNYTGLLPIYGRVKNRLFRDEVRWVLWPLYVETWKRDVHTRNYVAPFVHVREGGATGWQFWPLYGTEHREPETRTNPVGEREVLGGYDKQFALFPIYWRQQLDVGTTNRGSFHAVLPFWARQHSPTQERHSYLWPLGVSIFEDRARDYHETGLAWPLVAFGRGPDRRLDRVFPLFSSLRDKEDANTIVLWPLYRTKHRENQRIELDRTSVLLFLYTDVRQRDKSDGRERRRTDLWPLFTARRDYEGRERLQLLAPFEPILPESDGVKRSWSPLWSVWRSEKNPQTGAASHSLLWNLYRHESAAAAKKCSLLFGLVRYETGSAGSRWRVAFVPFGKNRPRAEGAKP